MDFLLSNTGNSWLAIYKSNQIKSNVDVSVSDKAIDCIKNGLHIISITPNKYRTSTEL